MCVYVCVNKCHKIEVIENYSECVPKSVWGRKHDDLNFCAKPIIWKQTFEFFFWCLILPKSRIFQYILISYIFLLIV